MKKEPRTQIVNNNWGFGEIFRCVPIKWIFKWILIISLLTAIINGLFTPVEIDTNFNCNSGNFGLEFSDKGMNRTSVQEIKIDGIENMRCTGNIKIKAPLILALFT